MQIRFWLANNLLARIQQKRNVNVQKIVLAVVRMAKSVHVIRIILVVAKMVNNVHAMKIVLVLRIMQNLVNLQNQKNVIVNPVNLDYLEKISVIVKIKYLLMKFSGYSCDTMLRKL